MMTLKNFDMTQEEKQLLLVDLCGRLLYGIFVKDEFYDKNIYTINYHPHLETCKPYLRPMSSMTDEEKEELENIEEKYFGQALDKQIKECLSSSPKDESRKLEYFASSKIVDYLNKHHFDYRGLIQIGLAIEASKDIYKIE